MCVTYISEESADRLTAHLLLTFHPQAISNKDQHSISYTLSRAQTVVVEYTQDSNTDMFQVFNVKLFFNRENGKKSIVSDLA